MKPKTNRAGDANKSHPMDRCYTPAYALDPLLPYLRAGLTVWECAAGAGYLCEALAAHGCHAIGSDLHGDYATPPRDFFGWQPPSFDILVTNPPYSVKFAWLERCYTIGKPFALLVPVEMIGAQRAQKAMKAHGVELMLLNRRVNFQMPNKGFEGSAAQFPVLWLCWRLLPAPIVYGEIQPRKQGAAQQSSFLEAA